MKDRVGKYEAKMNAKKCQRGIRNTRIPNKPANNAQLVLRRQMTEGVADNGSGGNGSMPVAEASALQRPSQRCTICRNVGHKCNRYPNINASTNNN